MPLPITDLPEVYQHIRRIPRFEDLPDEVKEDLLAWNNVLDEDDPAQLARLHKLYVDGRFQAWSCPECGERVYWAEPFDWRFFQGTCNADYTSYPGDSEKYQLNYLCQLCDNCRMTK